MDRILVIDDDIELCELVREYLEPEGFSVEYVHEGEEGVARALGSQCSLIVLDVMLPGLGGFEILRRVRARSHTPVLMLTARSGDVDRILGLELGADDYLPKPFNPLELVARIRAILRRTLRPSGALATDALARLVVGDLELDQGARVVRRAGEIVEMTSAEFELLTLLLRSAGSTVTREEISLGVLGRQFNPLDRSIDMHVSNLRRKLGPGADGIERIRSVRGVGYFYARCETRA